MIDILILVGWSYVLIGLTICATAVYSIENEAAEQYRARIYKAKIPVPVAAIFVLVVITSSWPLLILSIINDKRKGR